MEKYDVIILGCGACGSMCGIVGGSRGKRILIIDKELKPAKKILATGNGKCNLTNMNMSSEYFNQNIDNFLSRFSNQDTLDFFSRLGLNTYADSEGRVYPLSNSAKSVSDIINISLKEHNIEFLGENEVKNVKKKDNFIVETDKQTFECNKLVFALGGKNILLAKDFFGEEVVPPKPSLVTLKANVSRSLIGTKISNCQVLLTLPNGEKFSDKGEVLFRENGISGICVFNLSSRLARMGEFKGKISIDLFPHLSLSQIEKMITSRPQTRKISQIFDGLLLPAIGYEILNRIKLNEEKPISSLDERGIHNLAKLIKGLEFEIKGACDNNQVFSGGVKLSSLTENLESRKTRGLFFGGEACDVDGECGGYNLQWAWTSGKIIGDAL